MLKTLFIALCALTIAASQAEASTNEYSLGEALKIIKSLPQTAALYEEVDSEGPVQFVYKEMEGCAFNALWNGEERVIYVNALKVKTVGKMVSSILFELHNAQSDKKLMQMAIKAEKGMINRESYVSAIEKIEYTNLINTAKLLDIGIEQTYFPKDSAIPAFNTFSAHYKLQQLFGHSQWLAEQYDLLNPSNKEPPFSGTIPQLQTLTPEEKQQLLRYLVIKDSLHSPEPKRAAHHAFALTVELALMHSPKQQLLLATAFEG